MLTARVHQRTRQRTRQRLAEVGFDGLVEVAWIKKRWACDEQLCAKRWFTEHTDQVPPRARLTQRLKDAILDAVAGEVRAVDRVAGQFGVSWSTVQRLIGQAAAVFVQRRCCRPRLVRHLRIDEQRFRSARWFTDDDDAWRRIEPWMTTFVDLATGEVIDVVDGRDAAAVAAWIAAHPRWWRHRVEVVAIARERKKTFDHYVAIARIPEATRLKKTVDAWWIEVETFVETRVTNARTEAANVTIKNIERTGRGYRSHTNYRSRIMLYSAARRVA